VNPPPAVVEALSHPGLAAMQPAFARDRIGAIERGEQAAM
jgi:hypothetical protein